MAKITSTLLVNLKPSPSPSPYSLFFRLFSRNTKVNFSLSDSESEPENNDSKTPPIHKTKLPPPYDPFNKTPPIQQQPNDPTNLQQIFHNIRTNGLHDHAVKMFDALSKHNLTHEALQLFSQIQNKGQMPEVIAHTAVIQAYADAGKPKDALKVFERMLACGVLPNAYTYSVLVNCLGRSGEWKMVKEGGKWFCEMMGKGIRPNAETCVALFEGVVKCGKMEEGRELVRKMKEFGFQVDEKGVREVIKGKRGSVYRSVMDLMFGK
nr:hypothetical protein [Tanacetum cinerariifolium]